METTISNYRASPASDEMMPVKTRFHQKAVQGWGGGEEAGRPEPGFEVMLAFLKARKGGRGFQRLRRERIIIVEY